MKTVWYLEYYQTDLEKDWISNIFISIHVEVMAWMVSWRSRKGHLNFHCFQFHTIFLFMLFDWIVWWLFWINFTFGRLLLVWSDNCNSCGYCAPFFTTFSVRLCIDNNENQNTFGHAKCCITIVCRHFSEWFTSRYCSQAWDTPYRATTAISPWHVLATIGGQTVVFCITLIPCCSTAWPVLQFLLMHYALTTSTTTILIRLLRHCRFYSTPTKTATSNHCSPLPAATPRTVQLPPTTLQW